MNQDKDYGTVKISDDVVSIIASVAATEVLGVAGMSGGITGGITEMLGKKNLSKGVKVDINNDTTAIDTYIIVEYGTNIGEIARKLQENIKNSVETMTGLNVEAVNVYVQGVNIPKENKNEEEANNK